MNDVAMGWLLFTAAPLIVIKLTKRYHIVNDQGQAAVISKWKKVILFLLFAAAIAFATVLVILAIKLSIAYTGDVEIILSPMLQDMAGFSWPVLACLLWFITAFFVRKHRSLAFTHFIYASIVIGLSFLNSLYFLLRKPSGQLAVRIYSYHDNNILYTLLFLGAGAVAAILCIYIVKHFPCRINSLLQAISSVFCILAVSFLLWNNIFTGPNLILLAWPFAVMLFLFRLTQNYGCDGLPAYKLVKTVYVTILRVIFALIPYISVFLFYCVILYTICYYNWERLPNDTIFYLPPLVISSFNSLHGLTPVANFMSWLTASVIAACVIGGIITFFRSKTEPFGITLAWYCIYAFGLQGFLIYRLYFMWININDLFSLEELNENMRLSAAYLLLGAVITLAMCIASLVRCRKYAPTLFSSKRITPLVLSMVLFGGTLTGIFAFRSTLGAYYGFAGPVEFYDNTPIHAKVLANPPELPGHTSAAEPQLDENEWWDRYIPRQPQDEFALTVNDFAARSSHMLLRDMEPSENAVYSPVVSYMALAMLASHLDSPAQQEIYRHMGLDGAYADNLDKNIAQLLGEITLYDENGDKQIMAASFWLDNRLTMREGFARQFADTYYATVFQTNMQGPQAKADVNTWVNQSTRGMVPELAFEPGTDVLLASTLYFDCGWLKTFNPLETQKGDFYLVGGNIISCGYMSSEEDLQRFIYADNFMASYLPFRSGAKMHFILPHQGVTVTQLLQDPQIFSKAIDYTSDERAVGGVRFKIPRFSFDSELELDDLFKSLGIREIYSSPILPFLSPQLRMADITAKQKNTFAINEQGVRAASASTALYNILGAKPSHIDLILDRPFLFAVTSEGGTVLFTGAVYNPAA